MVVSDRDKDIATLLIIADRDMDVVSVCNRVSSNLQRKKEKKLESIVKEMKINK